MKDAFNNLKEVYYNINANKIIPFRNTILDGFTKIAE